MSESREDKTLPPGSLRVRVVDSLERPLPDAAIQLGILRSMGDRETMKATSDASGQHLFTELPVGDKQAYRVNVLADGARFSSNPFRLPHKHGQEVLIRRMPTTRSPKNVVLYVGAVSVELKDERLKVAQQQRLVNIGSKVYVFPEEGMRVTLPEGFTAFQTQDTMGDQRISTEGDELVLKGSLPPGQTTLLWGYDIPIAGTEQEIAIENPLVTFAYRVLADAPEGLQLSVDGFPPAQLHEDRGKRFWVTEVQRKPSPDGLKRIVIRIAGIPGPGPLRWIAAALALLAVLGGALFASRKPERDPVVDHEALLQENERLLAEARGLRQEREEDAIGPEYLAQERGRLVDELAVVLFQLDDTKSNKPAGAGK